MSSSDRLVENIIMRKTIKALIAAGYSLSVNDGEKTTVHQSVNSRKIFNAMKTTDEDLLLVYNMKDESTEGQIGWVRFIYGNEGAYVINDYTSTTLEAALRPVYTYIDKLIDA